MHRLFAAIPPPDPVLDALIDTTDGIDGARWQGEDQLHLTLRFIGEVERPLANELAEALAEVQAPSFNLQVAGTGHFERKGRPHSVWARVLPSAGLDLLHGRVERACQAIGLPRETRKFVPHVTLARLSGGAGLIAPWLADTGTLQVPEWRVEGFTLYESHLGKAGALYQPVVDYPLGESDTAAVPVSRTGR
ncbi:RNA 2',3'-cyclic phosphodiesterase [Croceibacterium ferulae]|uniref:RNA 2',3'-cyclic phosphodiesterase n=1 Tax=Croceibacterium ferulae TaxID=1854641 RepID=UPI000EB23498|nr:RNA 2',3'-cyclic phosphodiesterase [Croceibacterium ferulae]